MHSSGLSEVIGRAFAEVATAQTYPLLVYSYSGIVNYFVPSGGSKWAIEAPYILAAGQTLHVATPKVVLAYAWGDMLTDVIQVDAERTGLRREGIMSGLWVASEKAGLALGPLMAGVTLDLSGFVESLRNPTPWTERNSFHDWSLSVFGRGISEAFMFPYNAKLFRRDPREMTADWVSWAVPKPSPDELIRGALGIENRGLGYNTTFRYPKKGGIGILPEALARRVPQVRYGARVEAIDLERRTARLAGGEELSIATKNIRANVPVRLNSLWRGYSCTNEANY